MRLRIKICGITELESALTAVECGADALGFVFYEKSPRDITPLKAGQITSKLPPFVNKTGVFVRQNMDEILSIVFEAGLDTIQLLADPCLYNSDFIEKLKGKSKLPVILSYRLEKLNPGILEEIFKNDSGLISAYLIDKYDSRELGGTGRQVELENIEEKDLKEFLNKKIILAGGINSRNVLALLSKIHPYGIDISSGVEKERGIKDSNLIREFFQQVAII
jgi:phosphoribosylanthranilate isomerase